MPITFACGCGKGYTVADALAGKRTKCPACGAAIVVPEPVTLPVEEEPVTIMPDDEPEPVAVAAGGESDVVEDDFEVVDDEPAPAAVAAEPKEPADDLEFAVGVLIRGAALGNRQFRIYRVGGELLFVDAGPSYDPTLAATGGSSGAAGAANGGLVGGLVGGMIAATIQAVQQTRQTEQELRRKELDRLSATRLRVEAVAAPSYTADAAKLDAVTFDKPSFWQAKPSEGAAGVLRFTHATLGKVALVLPTLADCKLAVYKFVAVLGPKAVAVNLPVRKKRKRTG